MMSNIAWMTDAGSFVIDWTERVRGKRSMEGAPTTYHNGVQLSRAADGKELISIRVHRSHPFFHTAKTIIHPRIEDAINYGVKVTVHKANNSLITLHIHGQTMTEELSLNIETGGYSVKLLNK